MWKIKGCICIWLSHLTLIEIHIYWPRNFAVITALLLQIQVFWDVMLIRRVDLNISEICSPFPSSQSFETSGTTCQSTQHHLAEDLYLQLIPLLCLTELVDKENERSYKWIHHRPVISCFSSVLSRSSTDESTFEADSCTDCWEVFYLIWNHTVHYQLLHVSALFSLHL